MLYWIFVFFICLSIVFRDNSVFNVLYLELLNQSLTFFHVRRNSKSELLFFLIYFYRTLLEIYFRLLRGILSGVQLEKILKKKYQTTFLFVQVTKRLWVTFKAPSLCTVKIIHRKIRSDKRCWTHDFLSVELRTYYETPSCIICPAMILFPDDVVFLCAQLRPSCNW